MIVEPVPSARLEQGYAAQVLVYDDETYMMQDVAEEQEVETENSETGRHHRVLVTYNSFNESSILCVKVFCLHVCLVPKEITRRCSIPATGVMDGYKPPYGCRDLNLGPGRKQALSYLSSPGTALQS